MKAPTVSLSDQAACVAREIAMRERVYPKWVAAGRMTQRKADAEIAAMRAVLDTLEQAEAAQQPRLFRPESECVDALTALRSTVAWADEHGVSRWGFAIQAREAIFGMTGEMV